MRTCGRRWRLSCGLALALLAAGCNRGGADGDGFAATTSDLGMERPTDLQRREDASGDLRRPVSDQIDFGKKHIYEVADPPWFLLVCDINRDGKLDVLATGGDLSVLLGRGDGTMRDALITPSGRSWGLDVADVNDDGKLDVVQGIGKGVQVLLGKGNGTFESPRIIFTCNNCGGMALGDVNGDGKIDLALNVEQVLGPAGVQVMLGAGDGNFTAGVKLPTGLNSRAVRFADLNRDGKLDLVVADNENHRAMVALGQGNGAFLTPQSYDDEPGPLDLRVVDLNGDGALDLVVNSEGTAKLSLHLGQGDGSFRPTQRLAVPTERNTNSLTTGDLNGDGVPDIVVASGPSGAQVSALFGHGDGSFFPPRPLPQGMSIVALAIGDFNADGLPDLVVADNWPPSTVTILLNTTLTP